MLVKKLMERIARAMRASAGRYVRMREVSSLPSFVADCCYKNYATGADDNSRSRLCRVDFR
jgi:hypothetical protein